MKNEKANIFTLVVVFLPILSVYASGIPGFSFGDVCLFLVFIYYILNSRKNKLIIKKNNIVTELLIMVISIIVLTMIDIIILDYSNYFNIIIRIIRKSFYYCTAALFAIKYFNYYDGEKLMIKVGLFATFYLFLQYLFFYTTGFVLKGFIPFLPLYHETYSLVDYSSIFTTMYRPTSILLEPAHISRYLCIPLIISLFDDRIKIKNRIIISLLLSLAIFMTTSGTGIICVTVIWLVYFIKMIFKATSSGKLKIYSIFIIIFFIIFSLILLNSSFTQNALYRISYIDLLNVNTAGGARFRGFVQYSKLPLINKIFGVGYGNIADGALNTWYSGASYMLYGCGIIGFVICLFVFFTIFKKLNNPVGKVLLLIWFILFFVDDSFMSHLSVLYFCFIVSSNHLFNKSILKKDLEV